MVRPEYYFFKEASSWVNSQHEIYILSLFGYIPDVNLKDNFITVKMCSQRFWHHMENVLHSTRTELFKLHKQVSSVQLYSNKPWALTIIKIILLLYTQRENIINLELKYNYPQDNYTYIKRETPQMRKLFVQSSLNELAILFFNHFKIFTSINRPTLLIIATWFMIRLSRVQLIRNQISVFTLALQGRDMDWLHLSTYNNTITSKNHSNLQEWR